MFHILEGQGAIQVDFRNYYDWENKIIFLEKGQYIRFLNSGFVVRKLEFQETFLSSVHHVQPRFPVVVVANS